VDPDDRERLVRTVPPPTGAQLVINDTLARTPDGCAAVNVVITATTLSTAFPQESSCGAGMILRPGGNHFIDRDTTHWRISLRVAWRNNTGASISGSDRLILPADSGIVLLPVSSYGTDPVAVAPSGIVGGGEPFAGAPYWSIGSGTTPNGNLTADTVVTVDVPVGTQHLLLRFSGDSLAQPVGRPPVPDGWWAPTDSTLAVENTDSYTYTRVLRMFVTVRFAAGASAAQVRSAFASQGAVIVGGRPALFGPGSYVVQLPDPGSFSGLKSVIAGLESAPGVASATKSYYGSTVAPRGRFPVDGGSLERWSWTDTSAADLAAWRAIGATGAWGCENGTYGTTISVAALDISFDASHQDLSPLVQAHLTPAVDVIDPSLIGTSGSAKEARSHGTAVIGAVAAVGDNGAGIAGALWAADVTLFGLAADSFSVLDKAPYFLDFVRPHLLSLSQPRILVSSTVVQGDSVMMRNYRDAISDWLTADAKRLFVYALPPSGNVSATDVAGGTVSGAPASDVAVAQLATLYPGQVLLVTSSDHTQGTLTGGVWTGVPVLAAPGVDVLTLARSNEFTGGRKLSNGTSHAAPLVAGAAAQLMAMAPNLTADSVIHYLLAGASTPRYDPWVDSTITPSPLAGTSLYQLHSFATLQLYSRTHASAPICGLEVNIVPGTGTNKVQIQRPSPTEIAPSGFGGWISHVSVAQGGRVMSVGGWDAITEEPMVKEYRLQSGTWTNVAAIAGIDERHYLEKDTLDVTLVCPNIGCGPSVTRRRSTGAITRVLPEMVGVNESAEWVNLDGKVAADPTGEWITFGVYGGTADTSFRKQVFLNLTTASTTTVRRWEWIFAFDPWNQGVSVPDSQLTYSTWNNAGDKVVSAYDFHSTHFSTAGPAYFDTLSIRLVPFSVTTGAPTAGTPTTVADRSPGLQLWFSADDRVFVHVEAPGVVPGSWANVRRSGAALGSVLGSTGFTWLDDRWRGYYPTGQLRANNPGANPLTGSRLSLREYRRKWRASSTRYAVIP
jgi:hypothetical protein